MKTNLKSAARLLGQLGGQRTHRKHGKGHFARLGRKGAQIRWSKAFALVPEDPPPLSSR